MSTEHHTRRKSVSSVLGGVLSEYGLEVVNCGGKQNELKDAIDENTGFWSKSGVASKPKRLLVHLEQTDSGLIASLPSDEKGGCIGYANTGRRNVGLLIVRILVLLKSGEKFLPLDDWEWLLWYCFYPSLENRNSGAAFRDFDPIAGTFSYGDGLQKYLDAGLITLNQADERKSISTDSGVIDLKYGDVTDALKSLIHVAT